MPIVQKIKSLVHRGDSTPQAPPAPVVDHVAPVVAAPVAPLTSDTLLAQKEVLAHDNAIDNRNVNVYNNLAGSELRQEESLLRQESLLREEQLLRQEPLLAQQTTYVQSAQRASLVRQEPTIIETIEKDVVIQERIHPVEKEEIQPIIYREREQLDVKQVTQMMHETQIQPTLIEQRELAAEYREAVVERAAPIEQNIVLPSTQVDATQRTQVVHAPIVEEVIKKTVIQEIQPVLERDVYQPTIIQNTQAIHEKIVEAPTVYREVREVQELGTRTVGMDSALVQEAIIMNRDVQNLSSSAYDQTLSQNYVMTQQNLSQNSYDQQMLAQNGQLNGSMLATGQVLPQIQSSRPAYAYLPSNYVEQRPTFIGTASEYVRAASGMPQTTFAHTKNLPTVYPTTGLPAGSAPLAMPRQ